MMGDPTQPPLAYLMPAHPQEQQHTSHIMVSSALPLLALDDPIHEILQTKHDTVVTSRPHKKTTRLRLVAAFDIFLCYIFQVGKFHI